MRILHISDLHIGKGETELDETKQAKMLVGKICTEWEHSRNKPVVLITGDVVDDGQTKEYKVAREVLTPLWDAGFIVAPVPGNHDYGPNGSHALERRFKRFKKYLMGIENRVTYPDVPFSNHQMTLITLNSMKAETGFWQGLLADGELGSNQLNELGELIATLREEKDQDHRIVVALHHHPFLFPDDSYYKQIKEWLGHRLKDGADLMRIVTGRIDALLFGHDHKHVDFSKAYQEEKLTELYKIPCILSSGKSTDPSFPARVITVDGRGEPRAREAPWRA